jgi:tetratricopeptide (TPR) repeat protein
MDLVSLFDNARSHHGEGDIGLASAICEEIIARQPRHSGAHYMLGMIAYQQGEPSKAISHIDMAIGLTPQHANIHSNRGLILQALGRIDEAVDNYDRAIALDQTYVDAHYNRGIALQLLGRPEDAIASYNAAIALEPQFAEAHLNRASALQDLAKFEASLASYDAALALQPLLVEGLFGRAVVLNALHQLEAAVKTYDALIALEPKFVPAHFNRGNILKDLGRLDEALLSHERALVLKPDDVDTKKAILASNLGRLMRDPARVERLSIEISAAEVVKECATAHSRSNILGYRALHDLEYTDYLIAVGYSDANIIAANTSLREICARHTVVHTKSPKAIEITLGERDAINRFKKTAPRYHMPLSLPNCLNENNDWSALEEQYLHSRPEIAFIDNMLSDECLAELRKFCLISPVWRREYKAHYLGANFEEGFVSPLHLQIAAELRKKMPRVFGHHDLTQLWAFKYSSTMGQGINVHADFARVNLNFWITPDEANLDPESGGLIVYDVAAPSSWTYQDYNKNEGQIYAFLKQHSAGSRTISYKCNRAALFNSNLFHETDKIRFKTGYQNRRINVTYLFGRGLQY